MKKKAAPASRALAAPLSSRLPSRQALLADLQELWFSTLKPTTRKNYGFSLLRFCDYVGVPDAPALAREIAKLDAGTANGLVLRYRGDLQKSGFSTGTVNVRLSAIRSFVAHLRRLGLVAWTLEVPLLPYQAYRDTRGCSREEIDGTVTGLLRKGDPRSRRDAAVLSLLYRLALRCGEVHGLDLEHVEADYGAIWILGKGRHDRERITLPSEAAEAVKRWVEARGRKPGPLFYNFDPTGKGGGRLSERSIERLTDRYHLGHPHGLRHRGITDALDVTGGDVRAVQRFSRHRDLNTLLVYDDNRRDLAGEVARRMEEENRRRREVNPDTPGGPPPRRSR